MLHTCMSYEVEERIGAKLAALSAGEVSQEEEEGGRERGREANSGREMGMDVA